MAIGGNAVLPTDRRAGEGHLLRLIQCASPSNAPDNSIGKFADWLKSIPRSTYPRLISLASIFSQLLRTWPGSRQNGASGPFPFDHDVTPTAGFCVVADQETGRELIACQKKEFARTSL